jgi:hypothetical protein
MQRRMEHALERHEAQQQGEREGEGSPAARDASQKSQCARDQRNRRRSGVVRSHLPIRRGLTRGLSLEVARGLDVGLARGWGSLEQWMLGVGRS